VFLSGWWIYPGAASGRETIKGRDIAEPQATPIPLKWDSPFKTENPDFAAFASGYINTHI
jgi:hypothetical protein